MGYPFAMLASTPSLGEATLTAVSAPAPAEGELLRSQVTVPVCPAQAASDQITYEQPADPTKKLVLPRYRVAQTSVSGHPQYRMRLQATGQAWQLIIHLEKFFSIASPMPGAVEVPHDLSVNLRFQVPISGAGQTQIQRGFQELAAEEGGARATLNLATLDEMNQVFSALTDLGASAALVVHRTPQVAVQVDDLGQLATQQGQLQGTLNSLQGSLQQLQGQAADWARRLEAHQQQIRQQIDQLKAQIASSTQSIAGAQAAIQNNNQTLQNTVSALQSKNAQLQANIDQLSNTLADLDQQASDIEDELANFLQIGPSGKPINPALAAKLRAQLAAIGAKRAAVSGQIRSAQSAVQSNNRAIQTANQQTAAQNGALQTQIGNLQQQVSDANAQINQLSNASLDEQHQLDSVKQQIANTQGQIGSTQAQLATVSARVDNPRYRVISPVLDQTVDPNPFVFPKDTNEYIFDNVVGPNDKPGLTLRQVKFGDRFYGYYQDEARPYLFYYLPDSFKLARRRASPHYPSVAVQFSTSGDQIDQIQAILSYAAAPVVDQHRLAAAASELAQSITDPLPSGVSGLTYAPLPVDSSKIGLRLALPPGGEQERTGFRASLQDGIVDTLGSMSIDNFRSLYDAMASGSLMLFTGTVRVDLGNDQAEDIPLAARFGDMTGPIFDYVQTPDSASGGLQVTIRNAIESPVRIISLGASMARSGVSVLAQLQGLTSGTTLRPGDDLVVTAAPAQPISGSDPWAITFDLSGCEVLVDTDAVGNAILDNRVGPEYSRMITVQTFPQTYSVPAGHPENQITAVIVKFDNGDTVEVDAAHLTAQAKVRMPIADYVFRRSDEGAYHYRLTVVRDGVPKSDNQVYTDNSGILTTLNLASS